jgi:signal transduction histidine kinase
MASPEITLRQLAHELNSLLDGSMRCVGMARTSLQQDEGPPAVDTAESADEGLGKAIGAMKHMAALLQRAMRLTAEVDAPSTVAMFHTDQTLRETVAEVLHLVQPLANAREIAIEVNVPRPCERLPAGPLGVVLLNGVRNAIESCARKPASPSHRIRLTVALAPDAADTLNIVIDDTGEGAVDAPVGQRAKPGHGIGLSLSHQIVRELGGEIALLLRGPDRLSGASLHVTVPVRSLNSHG